MVDLNLSNKIAESSTLTWHWTNGLICRGRRDCSSTLASCATHFLVKEMSLAAVHITDSINWCCDQCRIKQPCEWVCTCPFRCRQDRFGHTWHYHPVQGYKYHVLKVKNSAPHSLFPIHSATPCPLCPSPFN